MNELDVLTRVRAEAPPMSPHARQRGRAALAATMDGVAAPSTTQPNRRRRWAWRLAAAGVTGVAAVASVVIAQPGGPDTAQAARDVLNLAASASEDGELLDPRPDQFTYLETIEIPSPGAGYDIRTAIWASVDGGRRGEVRSTSIDACGPSEERPTEPCTTAGDFWSDGTGGFTIEPSLYYSSYTVLSTLPTDPEQLLAEIMADPLTDQYPDRDVQAWGLVRELAEWLPAAQRAALLRAAMMIPDIELIEAATDATGRTGVGVGHDDPRLNGLVVLIFDPSTYEYLGSQVIDEQTGDVMFNRAIVRTGVVDEIGQVPD